MQQQHYQPQVTRVQSLSQYNNHPQQQQQQAPPQSPAPSSTSASSSTSSLSPTTVTIGSTLNGKSLSQPNSSSIASTTSSSPNLNRDNGAYNQPTHHTSMSMPIQNVPNFHGGYHFVPEFLDTRGVGMRNSFESITDYNSLRTQHVREKSENGKPSVPPPAEDQRVQQAVMYEREARWAEVRKYSDFIRRFAVEASHLEITKESYYDLYNMAVCLLKAVDSLDPDKVQPSISRRNSEYDGSPQATAQVSQFSAPVSAQPDIELLQARKSFDYYYNRSTAEGPLFYNPQPALSAPFMASVIPQYQAAVKVENAKHPSNKTFTETPYEDDSSNSGEADDSKKGKRSQRRRRTAYTSRRNLQCHTCGVTETPEWRRGPNGDHTLCNACGLHYAKSMKKDKQKKDDDTRKHPMENNQSITSSGSQDQATPSTDQLH